MLGPSGQGIMLGRSIANISDWNEVLNTLHRKDETVLVWPGTGLSTWVSSENPKQ